MIYQGKTISIAQQSKNLHMVFDADDSINKFDLATIEELRESVAVLQGMSDIDGLYISSAKDSFIVGADIKQFHDLFNREEQEIAEAVVDFNGIFTALQNLPFVTIALIDGICLGGGFELALACDYRIASEKARCGLPEVKLGINPGFGGTIRLPRLIGVDNAVEWIATGKEYKAADALAVGSVDAVVASSQLEAAALQMIADSVAEKLDFNARKQEKSQPVGLNDMERLMAFTTAKGLVAAQAGPHMPAPVTAVKSIEQNAALELEQAVAIEAKFFARLAKTDVSKHLVSLFLNEQVLSKRTGEQTKGVADIENIAVIGAGIMGGGIAYQAAYKGVHAVMKDVAQQGLDQGLNEATQLLAKRVERGRMTAGKMAEVLNRIDATLHYAPVETAELAVEAVVENLSVKEKVLAEVEQQLGDDAVLCSNTSTLSITAMAKALKKPEQFCGMHFFNPVHKMPLVEVIRGEKSSDATIAKVLKLAKQMGKTPIVVNDCPGFYVNRVLFPYFAGFNHLLADGVDFQHIDKVMTKFGWPMGPAHLLDVVGIDTACHAAAVMAEGFPDRMAAEGDTAIELLLEAKRLGQKNGVGFYQYVTDKKGRQNKQADEAVAAIIKPAIKGSKAVTDEEIIERLMLPMCFEVARCMDEGIVASPVDADMGLLMGIGFPLFRGGPVAYMESVGLPKLIEQAKQYEQLGALYQAPEIIHRLVEQGNTFYQAQA